ncbi:hypothetical protein EUGRSUZ_C04348, partial [Eucalyptus grandis]
LFLAVFVDEFTFGFRKMGQGANSLAIWFEKLEDKTIVWSANGDNLAPEGSKIQLTTDGRLVLADPNGRELWSPSPTVAGVAHAAMLDTGKFVLVSQNYVNLWETFSQPTDTILPTQQLDQGTKVNARYSEMNYSTGRFHFKLGDDGNLAFYATSNPFTEEQSLNTMGSSGNMSTLRGQIQVLPWHWAGRCIRQTTGSGACGFNSYCALGDDQRPRCHCPPGYTPLDSTNQMNECREDFVPQSCDGSRPETDQFALHEMLRTNWPRNDYAAQTEDKCREACLADCFCAVAIFGGSGTCYKKNPMEGWILMETRIPLIIIESVLLSSSVFVNLLLLLITYLIYRRFRSRDSKLSRLVQINQATGMQTFTYQELQEATDEFKEELGRGAFGTVYKGVLGSEDTNFVVVKVLATRTGERENEFEREVSAIGQTNHKHLVQLLGFCNEGQHRLLVYEFMSNDTLADFLFGISKPTWYKRIEIAYVRGTRGYLAPEWFKNMPISNKVDVYSFGILLVELICCRKNYEPGAEIEAQIVLVDWVYECYLDGNVLSLMESDEEASNNMRRVRRFVMTTLWCIQEDLALRLAMKKITQMLEGAVEVPVPPFSSSFISSI